MEVIPVFRDEVQVVVPKSHALAKHKSVTVEELAQHPLILPKTGHTRVVIDRLLRAHRDILQISMELASVETIKKFVGAGLGISLISRTYVQPEVAAGLLKLIPLEGQKIYRELGLGLSPATATCRFLPRFFLKSCASQPRPSLPASPPQRIRFRLVRTSSRP